MEVTLKEYIESRMDEREKAHVAQIINAERSIDLAANSLREKLEQMNEFRRQIDSERALYVQRPRLDELSKRHDGDIQRLVERLENLENWQSNVAGRQVVFGAAVVLGAGTLAGVVVSVLRMVAH